MEKESTAEQLAKGSQNALQLIEKLVEDCYQAEKDNQSQITSPAIEAAIDAAPPSSKTVESSDSMEPPQSKESTVRLVEMDKLLKVNSPSPGEKRECINFDCKSKKSVAFYKAPIWALSYFNVPRKVNRNQFICQNCFDVSVNDYERLCGVLVNQQPLLLEKLPVRPEVVEILDSDDEDNSGSNTKCVDVTKPLSLATLTLLEDHFEDVLKETFDRINITQQTSWTNQILKVSSSSQFS